jgi:O-succinylbenzoate synthase
MPKSHYLAHDIAKLNAARLKSLTDEGFTHVKLKMGRKLKSELEKWLALAQAPEAQGLRWRFDFNASASFDQVVEFAAAIPEDLKSRIDFVEDPIVWNAEEWARLKERTGLCFALDRAHDLAGTLGHDDEGTEFSDEFDDDDDDSREGQSAVVGAPPAAVVWPTEISRASCDVLILKPALQNPQEAAALARAKGLRLVVTSYLDHPVGQLGAAFEAARLLGEPGAALEVCGLVSHLSYRQNEFSAHLKVNDARLIPPLGAGIGFDDLLAAQDWWEL